MGKLGSIRKTTVMPLRSPTTFDLYWAAGFLEGEGHFGHCSSGKGQRVSANQNSPECPQRLADLFGGRVRERIYKHGAFKGTKYESLDDKVMFSWEITGPLARGVMMTLFSLLSNRRKFQIKAALI